MNRTPVTEVPPGLERVAVAHTTLSQVDGDKGFFHIRGYDGAALAETATVEDVWHLLYEGELPTDIQRRTFSDRTRRARILPEQVRQALPLIAGLSSPGSIHALRTSVSLLGQALESTSWTDQPFQDNQDQALQFSALLPVLAAGLWRTAHGEQIIEPSPDLGYAANYLHMIHGQPASPTEVEALERYLLLTVEHGFNNSTFAARVITSSGADIASAISGAIGAFSGPLHGGAVGRVTSLLDAVGDPDNAADYVRETLDRGERIMGFGHPVYRTIDPRSRLLRRTAETLGGRRLRIAQAFEDAAVQLLNERFPGRRREANVDFYAGIVLEQASVPEELFTSTFAIARVIGWTAHILEQIQENRIFRPSAHYTGPTYPR